MNISDIRSPIADHKVSSGGYFSESDMKAILPLAPLVRFLLTALSLGLPGGGCFYHMINYALKPLAILEIHRDIIKKTYV